MKNWGFKSSYRLDKNWPKDENGEPVKPVFLEHIAGSQLDVDVELNLFEAFNIPVMLNYPNNGEFGKIIIGFSGTGVDVYVPETMLEDAQNVLSGDMIDIDKSEENT